MTNTRKKRGKKRITGGKDITGGEIIGSGGFGCVFKPALKCKNKSIKYKKGQISKLMVKYESEKEYREITQFKKILKTIPNYSKYFLIDNITICEPAKLTKSDLKNYDSKCYALQHDNISRQSINTTRNKLMSISMPDGGIDLSNYFDSIETHNLVNVNNSLIDLLENGIIPMNKKGIFHSDVKDSNILVNPTCRLIDWGLSTEYYSKDTKIPHAWNDRPFQYNVPFSNILFNKYFIRMYESFLQKITPTFENIRVFAVDFIYYWKDTIGVGHYNAFVRLCKILYIDHFKNVPEEIQKKEIEDITIKVISEYLAVVILKYTRGGRIYLLDYMNDVYSKIIDVWGFIMCYKTILEYLDFNYNKLNKYERDLFVLLKKLFHEYLFSPRVEPINISSLVKELKSMNKLFIGFTRISSTPRSSVYEELSDRSNKTRKHRKNINTLLSQLTQ